MANHLAIASVTETLRQRILSAAGAAVPGTDVAARRPEAGGEQAASQVLVFLYRVTPNAALRNDDLATRGADGAVRRRPRAAIDLSYLLCFSGDEGKFVPQLLLGSTLANLHARPSLAPDEIRLAVQGEPDLGRSDLADEIERVTLRMAPLSLDELSKLWAMFAQTPYLLSVAYEASVVLIEAELTPREPLRVGRAGVGSLPLLLPEITGVRALGRADAAIESDTALEILGRRLRGQGTSLRFDGGPPRPVTPERDTRIVAPAALVGELGAGVHSVQVVHDLLIGDPPAPHQVVESNAAPFVLRPRIAPTLENGALAVRFTPPVRPGQRVRLLLNELTDGPAPRFHSLAPENQGGDAPQPVLRFGLAAVGAGTYLARAQVDGAESLVELHPDPADRKRQRPEPQVVIL